MRWELPLAVSGGRSAAPPACCREGSLLLSLKDVLKAELEAPTEAFPEVAKELHPPRDVILSVRSAQNRVGCRLCLRCPCLLLR